MSKNHRRFKMDFLSSSSEDEKPMGIKSEYVLEDSSTSSEEDIHVPKSSRNKNSRTIEDLSSALSSIKIGDNTHTKSIISISDDSSDDDDSILKYKSPFKLTSKPITLDDSSDDDDSILNYKSPFKSKSKTITLDDDSSHEGGKTRSNKKKSKGPWRFSLSKKEYTLSETTDSVVPKFRIPGVLFDKLYSHQKEGVAWLAGLHTGGMGGLLGDDMGMGKTYQTLAFLGGLMRARTIRNAVILAPLSVLRSWEKEASHVVKSCVNTISIEVVSSDISKRRRQQILRSALECHPSFPHLIITTYGLVSSSLDDFTHNSYDWDYVVLDEAHKIKNVKALISTNVRLLARGEETRRLVLTGTPIMNNLKELWALFDFVSSGQLLGSAMSFGRRFQTPIEDARSKDATKFQIQAGQKANEELQKKLRPYLLQRLKVDNMADELPTKSDFVVWTHISQTQREMYETYINAKDSAVADILSGLKTSPLEAVTWLKKLCGHPILVSDKLKNSAATLPPSELIRYSSKLQVLDALVEDLRKNGHRMLIFSQSTKMLDIIQRVLLERVHGLSRIDGQTKERDRQRFVDEFNEKGSTIEVMLLSTGAGGTGLTLTGADRAIIYDPSWSPAQDAQAVDRCYRIGQEKPVSVYRLIAAGTVEEKMYEKQVHKDGIRRAVVTSMGASLSRYFDKHDLKKIFKLNPAGECEFLDRLGQRGRGDSGRSELLHRGVVGTSCHDVLYTEETIDLDAEDGPQSQTDSQVNPFSSPTKGAAHFTLHTPTQLESRGNTKKVLGKAQRALLKGTGEEGKKEPSFRMLGDKTNTVAKSQNQYESNTVAKSQNQYGTGESMHSRSKGEYETIEECFKEADRLSSTGRREDAMEILMNAMDKFYDDGLEKRQKMLLHGRISSIAYELRWL